MTHIITLIPGDGIGPEIVTAVTRIIEAAGVEIEWESHLAGERAFNRHGELIPKELLDSIHKNKVVLKGPVTTPVGKGFMSVNVTLRKRFELYANLRPVKTNPAIPSRFTDVDLIIVRENTEGLYSGLEHVVVPGVVESLKIITEKACRRVSKYAFEYARKHGRKRITVVHKANIMKLSDGLFLDTARDVGRDYPDIELDDRIVDNMCMQLVMNPENYDMLLLENLYGDIISDLGAGLVGGLGVVPGANIGEKIAIFEAVHGSAPDIAGKNLANPTALLLTACLMLDHIGETTAADRIRNVLNTVLSERNIRTRDLGGEASTSQFADAIITELQT